MRKALHDIIFPGPSRHLLAATVMAAATLAACVRDDETALPAVSADDVPIAFTATIAPPTRAASGYTGSLTAENHQLRYAGFGVFMSHTAGVAPDIMFNQQVQYVFPETGYPDRGYWTYAPVKYWPAQPKGVALCAYAPYVATTEGLAADATGIVGLSPNSSATPYIIYARAKHPEDNVDLLWSSVTVTSDMLTATDGTLRPKMNQPVAFEMHHALARVGLSIGITDGGTLLSGEKLLVRRVTLKGNFAKRGRMQIATSGSTPAWTDQELADASAAASADNTIVIDCNPDAAATTAPYIASYGIIDEAARFRADARYPEGLPNRWQPSGLPHTNYTSADATTATNLLAMGDAKSYLYLIPQVDLAMTCVIDYCRISADGTTVTHYQKTTDTPLHIAPLDGNRTYNRTFTITLGS